MTQTIDVIKGALRRITAYQSGEPIAPIDAQDCLDTFNDLLASISTDHTQVFGSNEQILSWIAQQHQYKVGNPLCTDIGEPPFMGTLTSGSNQITGVTSVPADLVAGTSLSAVGAGSTITDGQHLIPAGTYVTAISGATVTMSAAATANSQGTVQVTYSIPGDFPIARPLRITFGFTRINQLDFDFRVYGTQEEYLAILYKFQPGPWPIVGWYNNLMPYGILNVYQAPGNNAEVHLFTDTILGSVGLYDTLTMPQGYIRHFKWLLARELLAEFGYPEIPLVSKMAGEAMSYVKAVNARPAKVAKYDRELTRGDRPDGGWITHGGYR